ncbi:MAG: radical SAM protein [Planctomycetes bacterium]|nr:radical SAM protein [Planctomycetota bacterium]
MSAWCVRGCWRATMRVVLVNPPITSAERYGRDIGDIGGHQAPVGLCSLAAVLEQEGVDVTILDGEAKGLTEAGTVSEVCRQKPTLVGITSTTVAFGRALRLAQQTKRALPSVPIVIGGAHVTANPESTLAHDCFDFGVLREGEVTLRELTHALADGHDAREVDGLVFRDGPGLHVTRPRAYIRDLDTLPLPAYHLLGDLNRYLPPLGCCKREPVVSLVTSRGCPYQCIFCDRSVFGNHYRANSAEYVIAEIEHAVRAYGAREIAFLDDTFSVDRRRVKRICDLISEKRLDITWTCMTRADVVTKDLLQAMRRSGCWQVSIGVESGSQCVLDFIAKGTTIEEIRNAAIWAAETGISVKGFFMLGNPTETKATLADTLAFAKSLPLTDVVATIATPMPGSRFREIAAAYGRVREHDWSDLSYWEPVFVPNGLTEDDLYRAQRRFYREFYCRPPVLGRQMRKIHSFAELRKVLRNVRRLVVMRPKKAERHDP